MTPGDAVARAARATLGVRFRLHGRTIGDGLDCIGLTALALRAAGVEMAAPTGYRLSEGAASQFAAAFRSGGLAALDDDEAAPGDVLLCAVRARQLHLGIATGGGMIHADAVLGRVVERPGACPWPIVARWRVVAPQTSKQGEDHGDAGTDDHRGCSRGTGGGDAGGGDRAAGRCRDLCP